MSASAPETTGVTVWITGLPASGKTTLATALAEALSGSGRRPLLLDGDVVRRGLNADLGYSDEDRGEVTRRLGEVALLAACQGHDVIVAAISPSASGRAEVRRRHAEAGIGFFEVFLDTPIEECERRDPKGLYAAARRGDVKQFTGVSSPYERPQRADFVVPTAYPPEQAASDIRQRLAR